MVLLISLIPIERNFRYSLVLWFFSLFCSCMFTHVIFLGILPNPVVISAITASAAVAIAATNATIPQLFIPNVQNLLHYITWPSLSILIFSPFKSDYYFFCVPLWLNIDYHRLRKHTHIHSRSCWSDRAARDSVLGNAYWFVVDFFIFIRLLLPLFVHLFLHK